MRADSACLQRCHSVCVCVCSALDTKTLFDLKLQAKLNKASCEFMQECAHIIILVSTNLNFELMKLEKTKKLIITIDIDALGGLFSFEK